MKNKVQNSKTVVAPFEGGQIWQLARSYVQIELVGRTLVHYRHYTGMAKRPPILLSSKVALEKFLKKEHGTVIERSEIRPPTARELESSWRKPPAAVGARAK